MLTNDRKLISIICPVFNEEESIPLFYDRLQTAINGLREKYNFELIFTNNHSTDRTLETILNLRKKDTDVQVLTLSRNFGYQASITAGLRHASGSAVIIIDADCEDPPEMIPKFISEWENNYDIVYGKREKRSEFYGMHLARKAFYRLNRLIADSEIILDMAEFSLMSAHVRDAILDNRSTYPFLRTEVAYTGFKRKAISYKRQPRIRGKTNYNFVQMTKFAVGGILSSSTFPLRLAAYLCIPLILVNLLLMFLDFWTGSKNAFRILVSLDCLYVVFFTASICIYLARIYKDGVQRPIYVIDWGNSVMNNKNLHRTEASSSAMV